jgi:hypothetical protein
MDVPFEYCFLDARKPSELKTLTVNRHKRTDASKNFKQALRDGNMKEAVIWCCELHCSGKADIVWKEFLEGVPEYVNKGNPHLMSWIWHRYADWAKIEGEFAKSFKYETRNSQQARNLLIDLVAIVCSSNKNPIKVPKIGKTDTDISVYRDLIKAKNILAIKDEHVVNQQDPSEIKIAINEVLNGFGYVNFSLKDIIYWYVWLEAMEKLKGEEEVFFCVPRENFPPASRTDINTEARIDWVWAFWRAIFKEVSNRENPLMVSEIRSLFEIYMWKYSKGARKRKRWLIFSACALLQDDTNWKTKLIKNVKMRTRICAKVNMFYKYIDEKFDPYREISRRDYYKYIKPQTVKPVSKSRSRIAKIKEEIKKEKKNKKEQMKDKALFYALNSLAPIQDN